MVGIKEMKGKSIDEWIDEYAQAHQHPINRACHTWGIPMIVLSLVLMPLCYFAIGKGFWLAISLFVVGWALQFVGHAFEGKPPEFFRDWRFLFIGTKWWLKKMRGQI